MEVIVVLFVALSAIGSAIVPAALWSARGRRRIMLADAAGRLGLRVVEGARALDQAALAEAPR